MESLAGHLLIAIPELADPNFFHSVVLMLQHDDGGATGVILNRPSSITVANVWSEVSDQPCTCRQFVRAGGPVEGPLIALHTSPEWGESSVIPGVHVSLGRDHLDAIVTQETQRFRLFSGYSGWGVEQLQNEIETGGWLTLPATPEHVFASPDELWKTVCNTFGAKVLKTQWGNHIPDDPSLN